MGRSYFGFERFCNVGLWEVLNHTGEGSLCRPKTKGFRGPKSLAVRVSGRKKRVLEYAGILRGWVNQYQTIFTCFFVINSLSTMCSYSFISNHQQEKTQDVLNNIYNQIYWISQLQLTGSTNFQNSSAPKERRLQPPNGFDRLQLTRMLQHHE